MDIDLGIIRAVLAQGRQGLIALNEAGVTAEMLGNKDSLQARKALQFIQDHAREHDELPSEEYLHAKLSLVLPDISDPLSLFVKEVRQRHFYNTQRSALKSFAGLIKGKKVDDAHSVILSYVKAIRDQGLSRFKIDSLLDYNERVIKAYQDAKDGILGIPTPWPTINEMTVGLQPGDLIMIVARLSVGKTWALLLLAEHAWRLGYRVLFISTEMAVVRLAIRFFALHLRMPYDAIRRGQLGIYQEEDFFQKVRELGKDDEGRLKIMGAGFNATSDTIDDAIATVKPHLVCLDGIYMVKGKGRNRQERVADTVEGLKQSALRHECALAATTQFNREVKTNDISTVRSENIGITDVIGWVADLALAMAQTDDMQADRQMAWVPVKVREGEKRRDIFTWWDIDRMNFQEIGQATQFTDGDFDKYVGDEPIAGEPTGDSSEGDGIPF